MRNMSPFETTLKTKQQIYVSILQSYREKGEHHLALRNVQEKMLHQSLTNILFPYYGKFTMKLWIVKLILLMITLTMEL